jgi:hypothetical protein
MQLLFYTSFSKKKIIKKKNGYLIPESPTWYRAGNALTFCFVLSFYRLNIFGMWSPNVGVLTAKYRERIKLIGSHNEQPVVFLGIAFHSQDNVSIKHTL